MFNLVGGSLGLYHTHVLVKDTPCTAFLLEKTVTKASEIQVFCQKEMADII